jgi:glycosyltransferase involved in cell wall biosynthesis
MSDILVSTIVPTFNRAYMLRDAIESVIAQTYRPIEIIIVDDGSTDDTAQLLRQLKHEHAGVLRVIRQANQGAGPSRQVGLEAARGSFIQFLDSDDLLLPRKFELQVAGLAQDTQAGISYCATRADNEITGLQEITHRTDQGRRTLMPEILNERLWSTISPLYRRSVCEAIGPWSRLRIYEDWDYDCRAGLLGVYLHYCPEVLAIHRHHAGKRAGQAWLHDEAAMRDRVTAYRNIADCAARSSVPPDAPERRQLMRSLFWMAREAAKRGLLAEAKALFEIAANGPIRPAWDLRMFGAAASILGWPAMARLTRMIEALPR